MLSLSRFELLLRTYGAEPARWPQGAREGALALLSSSAQARRLHEEARRLDQHMDAALAVERPSPAQQDAAVARLRMQLAARLTLRQAPPPRRPRRTGLVQWVLDATSPRLYEAALAAGICLAIAAGLLVGTASSGTPAPAPAPLMSVLQPSPLPILEEGRAP